MKNQNTIYRIDSLIDTLNKIQLTSKAALTELHKIKHELISQQRATQATKQEQKDSTKILLREILKQKDTRPDTLTGNTGTTSPPQHTDSTGHKIKVGDTV